MISPLMPLRMVLATSPTMSGAVRARAEAERTTCGSAVPWRVRALKSPVQACDGGVDACAWWRGATPAC